MASSSYSTSVRQGFNFEKDAQVLVGHVVYLKAGGTELTADLTITDPEDVTKTKKVFGVASGIQWQGGYADPLQFSCQVSTGSKNKISTLVHTSMSDTEVELDFIIYDYDPKAKKYYQCFHAGGTKLKGLVAKSGGELAMNIDQDQGQEVVSPKNYNFQLGVMPQDLAQQIHVAVSVTDKFVKAWGVTVG